MTVISNMLAAATTEFYIRGKNPLDADARAYIDSTVDAEFRDYAWMIAKHESKQGRRFYNQFNNGTNNTERHNVKTHLLQFALPSHGGEHGRMV